jgi:hypothetical protein
MAKKGAMYCMAFLCIAVVAVPGGAFLLHPSLEPEDPWLWVACRSSLAEDGSPRLTRVYARGEIIGAVFLRRVPDTGAIVALSRRHSRYGLQLDFDGKCRVFRCPWNVTFDLDGSLRERAKYSGLTEDLRCVELAVEGDDVFIRRSSVKLLSTLPSW